MGNLKFYYDKIILNTFNNSNEETQNFFINEWDFSSVKHMDFYQKIENDITKQFNIVYESDLENQIAIVIKSLRRIINNNTDIKAQFAKLLDINANLPAQRSPEWHKFRENMITASNWGNVLGMIGSQREVLLQKLGHEKSQFRGNEFTRWGTKYEPVATSIYEKRTNKQIYEFGCMRHPDPDNFFLGASPDGIANDGIMLEIKCPPKRKIGPIPPDYYWAQMQGQLEVCDLEQCDFLECKLLEYDSQEEYENDIENNYTISKKMESGVVLTFKDLERNEQFFYSKFFIKGNELNKWIIEHIQEYQQKKKWKFMGSSYWYLVEYQCNPVFRDKKWFVDAREKLKQFYDLWQFYKKHGYESLLTERSIKPPPSGVSDQKLSSFNGFVIKNEVADEETFIKNFNGFGFKNAKVEDTTNLDKIIADSEEKKKSFGFKSNNEKPKQSFGFKSDNEKTKQSFGFKSTNEKPKQSFGFKSNNEKTKQSFGFKSDIAETKKSFGFKSDIAETKKSFGFKSEKVETSEVAEPIIKKKNIEERVNQLLDEDSI